MNVISRFLRKSRNFIFPTQHHYVLNSYSQCGEDRVLDFLFSQKGIDKISYIDIGAYKPLDSSNTYFFYSNKHANGVCVEPDIELAKIFSSTRPRDLVLNCAIDVYGNENVALYRFNEPSLNTLSKAEAERREKIGEYRVVSIEQIKTITLEKIIKDHFNNSLPLFISLDIEGVDYDVLYNFDFEKFKIPVFVVETVKYSRSHIKEKDFRIIDLMVDKGYFIYSDTYINTIFVLRDWYYV